MNSEKKYDKDITRKLLGFRKLRGQGENCDLTLEGADDLPRDDSSAVWIRALPGDKGKGQGSKSSAYWSHTNHIHLKFISVSVRTLPGDKGRRLWHGVRR